MSGFRAKADMTRTKKEILGSTRPGFSSMLNPKYYVAVFSRSIMNIAIAKNTSAVPATIRMYIEHLPSDAASDKR
jgi:hypothetical protein